MRKERWVQIKRIKKDQFSCRQPGEEWKLMPAGKPKIDGPYIVYAVLNKRCILAIGEGTKERMPQFQGFSCKKHTKAFIIAAASSVFEPKDANEYWYHRYKTKNAAKQKQDELHDQFGEIYLPKNHSAPTREFTEASNWLWDQIKIKAKRKFNPKPNPGLSAQMDLVMHDGDVLSVVLKHSQWKKEAKKLIGGYYK
jgi:hypothetical protein